jgi:hypothetical protein
MPKIGGIFSKYKLIHKRKDRLPRIYFYTDFMSTDAKRFVEPVLAKIGDNELVRQFKEINIVFQSQLRPREHMDLESCALGFILDEDLYHGRNNIFINWDIVDSKEKNKERAPHAADAVRLEDIVATIIHELAHIWNYKKNFIKEITQKNSSRLTRAFARLSESKKVMTGNKDFDMTWLSLRKDLLALIETIINEGMVSFYSDLVTGKKECSDESIRSSYAEACKQADMLNKDLEISYSRFREAINKMDAAKISRGSEKDTFNSFVMQNSELMFELLMRSAGSRIYGYGIGAHVYHLVWSQYENISDEDLARIDYRIVIKKYEDACSRLGWKPAISLRSEKGIFSYSSHVTELNRIRKESGKKIAQIRR